MDTFGQKAVELLARSGIASIDLAHQTLLIELKQEEHRLHGGRFVPKRLLPMISSDGGLFGNTIQSIRFVSPANQDVISIIVDKESITLNKAIRFYAEILPLANGVPPLPEKSVEQVSSDITNFKDRESLITYLASIEFDKIECMDHHLQIAFNGGMLL